MAAPSKRGKMMDVHVRFTPEDRAVVQLAADLEERSISQFIRRAAKSAADRAVLAENARHQRTEVK